MMPLTPYLEGGVFEPEQLEAMTAALRGVLRSLQVVDREDPLLEIVARKLIEIASTGVSDPDHLRDMTLQVLRATSQRSA